MRSSHIGVNMLVVKKVLTDVLELWAWLNDACWQDMINKKARGKESWLIIRECNALWVSGWV